MFFIKEKICSWTKCLENQPCDFIKMRKMRGEVGKKSTKKEMDNSSFYDLTRLNFGTLCSATKLCTFRKLLFCHLSS